MDKAVILGDYMDVKFMRGLKVARVMIDIPIEYGERFIQMFGTPDGSNPVKVAVARIQPTVAEHLPSGAPAPREAPSPPEPVETRRTYTRSQMAAIKLGDNDFQNWLMDQYSVAWNACYEIDRPKIEAADMVLKEILEIDSKKELDADKTCAAKWDALLTDFDNRAHIR